MTETTVAPPVVVVAGPTASGKSALALDAAVEFDGVVINADSMQVYRQLRVVTARPSPADEARAPHRLFGVLDAAEACSVGRWLAMATDEIAAAHGARRLPVVVGGTGLYLKALMEGLVAVPEVPEAVRAEAAALHARLGAAAFRDRLAEVDAEAAARLMPGDRQRLIRAWSVARATGRGLSEWQRRAAPGPAPSARFASIVLVPPKAELDAAVDARFEAMLAAGALDEVAALERLGLDPGLPAMKALGVPALRRVVQGDCDLVQAAAEVKRATRRYAKRQRTWLRHQMDGGHSIAAQYSESLRPEIFSFIRQFLLTDPP